MSEKETILGLSTDKVIAYAVAGFVGWNTLVKDVVRNDAAQSMSVSELSNQMESDSRIKDARLGTMEATLAMLVKKMEAPRFTDGHFDSEMRPRDAEQKRTGAAVMKLQDMAEDGKDIDQSQKHELAEIKRRLSNLEETRP